MSTTIDVSGLPAPVVRDILHLVTTLRESMATPDVGSASSSPDEWIRRWRAWTAGQPRLAGVVDDSREAIY